MREFAATLEKRHKQELSAIAARHKQELLIKDSYLKGFKQELLEQLTAERMKVIQLQKELETKKTE